MDSESGSIPLALYFVLKYLPLHELLVMTRVSRTLRDVVNHDTLLWLDIIIDKPLNRRVSDYTLMQLASKANGRLRRLGLVNCDKLKDDGLQFLVENNPLLEKLYLPGCTGLTPEGIIRSVRILTQRNSQLKSLKINGIYHLNKDHIATLESCLQVSTTTKQLNSQNRAPQFYQNYKKSSQCNDLLDDTHHHPIDVEICPRCNEVKMVFDCPRKMCIEKVETNKQSVCRGCYLCIPRCEECGVCIENEEEEQGETLCAENLCLNCWLQLPKCSFCNRPYCRRHADEYLQRNPDLNTAGFVCEICSQTHSNVNDYV